jgi:hypothetical protein
MNPDFGIQRGERGRRGIDLGQADRIRPVEDLALQVGEVDLVGVREREAPDAARGEVERGRAAEAARADDERVRRAQALLALDAELGPQDVAAVAEELLVVQRRNAGGAPARALSSVCPRACSARSMARS